MEVVKAALGGGLVCLISLIFCAACVAGLTFYVWLFVVLVGGYTISCSTAALSTWAWVYFANTPGLVIVGLLKVQVLNAIFTLYTFGWLIYGFVLVWGENTCAVETPELYNILNITLIYSLCLIGSLCLVLIIVFSKVGTSVLSMGDYKKLEI